MKITFVQSNDEYDESQRVIRAGLSLKKAKKGTWILPPLSKQESKFVVVDSCGKDVFVESFDTMDGALAYALRICDADGRNTFDRAGSLREYRRFT